MRHGRALRAFAFCVSSCLRAMSVSRVRKNTFVRLATHAWRCLGRPTFRSSLNFNLGTHSTLNSFCKERADSERRKDKILFDWACVQSQKGRLSKLCWKERGVPTGSGRIQTSPWALLELAQPGSRQVQQFINAAEFFLFREFCRTIPSSDRHAWGFSWDSISLDA